MTKYVSTVTGDAASVGMTERMISNTKTGCDLSKGDTDTWVRARFGLGSRLG